MFEIITACCVTSTFLLFVACNYLRYLVERARYSDAILAEIAITIKRQG